MPSGVPACVLLSECPLLKTGEAPVTASSVLCFRLKEIFAHPVTKMEYIRGAFSIALGR